MVLPNIDGAGIEPAVDCKRIVPCDVVAVLRRAEGGRQARHLDRLLDRHRHAVERAPHLALGERAIGGAGALSRGRNVGRDDGIECRIVFLDPIEIVVEQLETADLAPADHGGQPSGRSKSDIDHVVSLGCSLGASDATVRSLVRSRAAREMRCHENGGLTRRPLYCTFNPYSLTIFSQRTRSSAMTFWKSAGV